MMKIQLKIAGLMLITALITTLFNASGCTKRTPVEEISVAQSGIEVAEAAVVSGDVGEQSFDWPQWRGLSGGVSGNKNVPTQWSAESNIRWQADVPGRGHSSPIVVGDLVVLGTATENPDQQLVVAYDRNDGQKRWSSIVHDGGFPTKRAVHMKATNANGTIASDGNALVTAHLNSDRIWVTAFDFDGNRLWQTDIGAFDSKFGYAPSPIIYKSLVIVAADNRGGGYLVGLDIASGQIAWRRSRGDASSYSSPSLVKLGGTDQIVITGNDRMASYQPATGDLIWETECIAEATCGTVVAAADRVFGSGGYPSEETVCLDQDGKLVWSQRTKIYEPSMVTDAENLFGVTDSGIAYCWDVEDGTVLWKKRLGGNFSSSPVICDGNVYVADLSGNSYVFKASGESYQLVSKNRLGDDCYASPAIADDAIFFRIGFGEEAERTEKLFCIAEDG
ncbi:outer membrane biogenesis protein BamB [Rubripirellula obstinata]|uniref:Outer membrane biogenesis protein BamB n=1 Tax=Rubripirellula obstinata TaxID=406547 RepID=A0A5B1CQK4_9BACT|nr:PQQ-binding-like beta-propeller repeat protein [Rubripirellula obstinata]KAA1262521.1 outer membrane biogenesis protein BamB [Rubripirellula obstinata]